MSKVELGKLFVDGQYIFREGEKGDEMYVIQSGEVTIQKETSSGNKLIATLGSGEFFGEMALFDLHLRSASAIASGEAHILTVDRNKLFATINRDPSLAFRLIETLSLRIRKLNDEVSRLSKR